MGTFGGRQLRAGGWHEMPARPLPVTDARLVRAEQLVLTVEAVRRLAPGGRAGGAAARGGGSSAWRTTPAPPRHFRVPARKAGGGRLRPGRLPRAAPPPPAAGGGGGDHRHRPIPEGEGGG